MTQDFKCGDCLKYISQNIRIINGSTCHQFYHVKCCGITHKLLHEIIQTPGIWECKKCMKPENPKTKSTETCNKCRKKLINLYQPICCITWINTFILNALTLVD